MSHKILVSLTSFEKYPNLNRAKQCEHNNAKKERNHGRSSESHNCCRA